MSEQREPTWLDEMAPERAVQFGGSGSPEIWREGTTLVFSISGPDPSPSVHEQLAELRSILAKLIDESTDPLELCYFCGVIPGVEHDPDCATQPERAARLLGRTPAPVSG